MQDDQNSHQRRLFRSPEKEVKIVSIPGEDRIVRAAGNSAPSAPSQPPPLKHIEDFYYEGEMIVFTANHHLRRGYCCQSGCRHCPFPLEEPA